MKKILKPVLGTLVLGFSLTTFSAIAQTNNGQAANQGAAASQQADQHNRNHAAMSDDQIDQRYEAEKKRCENLEGDEKDVCEKQAETNRDQAKADSKQSAKTADARHEANKEKKDAQFELEKEKCKAMSGDAQDRCMSEVKTRYNK